MLLKTLDDWCRLPGEDLLTFSHSYLKKADFILDVGTGKGFVAFFIKNDYNATVYAIDPWKEGIETAKKIALENGIKSVFFMKQRIESHDFKPRYFDLIISNLGLNHVQNLEKAIFECHRLLKPYGILLFNFHKTDIFKDFFDEFNAVLTKENDANALVKLAAHRAHYSNFENNIEEICIKNGFKLVETLTKTHELDFSEVEYFYHHQAIKEIFLPIWLDIAGETAFYNWAKDITIKNFDVNVTAIAMVKN